jgi:type VI protein secretion system component VasK
MTAAQAASCNDPSGCRTLWEIIWSCLFTLPLCVWVSVHPNIPALRERWPKVALRRVGLMLAAMIAPELIIAWAIRQRMLAHELAYKYREGKFIEGLACHPC